jgi:superfamily II DNA or RNA helicase
MVAKLGAGDPNRTASQIALIINGAYVTGLTAEPADLRGDLVDAAMKLSAGCGPKRSVGSPRELLTAGFICCPRLGPVT